MTEWAVGKNDSCSLVIATISWTKFCFIQTWPTCTFCFKHTFGWTQKYMKNHPHAHATESSLVVRNQQLKMVFLQSLSKLIISRTIFNHFWCRSVSLFLAQVFLIYKGYFYVYKLFSSIFFKHCFWLDRSWLQCLHITELVSTTILH